MKFSIKEYKTIIFDCDGVILNSNNIKTKAFYNSALIYGEEFANELVEYHVNNGGISRYKKFEFFLNHIVGCDVSEKKLNQLLLNFSEKVKSELLKCEVSKGIFQLRKKLNSDWIVVSGGDQKELNDIFSIRKLDTLFVESSIYGSPDSKETILEREIKSGRLETPALFIGDSCYDHQAAKSYGIDFIFISKWTEFKDWRTYTSAHSIKTFESIKDLLFLI